MKLSSKKFSTQLLKWYDQQGRKDLPWRAQISPYRTWLSEIMLQQTQVTTVIAYFNRFIERFPKLQDLANASEDEVLHLWSGLGYYSRARNLHQTAKTIMTSYGGHFPAHVADLIKLPGIGRSTAGAISAIAFGQSASILDGNVKRVLTRIHAIDGWAGDKSVANKLWLLAEEHTSNERPGDYAQAIMDLGATLCTRSKPNCIVCPVKNHCQAHKLGKETHYPTRKPTKVLPTKTLAVLIIINSDNKILLEKRPAAGIWAGLWSLPECQPDADVQEWCQNNYGCKVQKLATLAPVKHSFSHFHLLISPIKLQIIGWQTKIMYSKPITWYDLAGNNQLGLATPIARLLDNIGENLHDTNDILSKVTERS